MADMERFPARARLNRSITFSTGEAMLAWLKDSAQHYGQGYCASLGCGQYEPLWNLTETTWDAIEADAEGTHGR